jgi:hypothetical protein
LPCPRIVAATLWMNAARARMSSGTSGTGGITPAPCWPFCTIGAINSPA